MYPTEKAPYYGTFVQSTEQAWRKVLGDSNVSLTAIREKPKGFLSKVFLYADLMVRCLRSLIKIPDGAVLEIHYPVYFLPLLVFIKVLRKRLFVVLRFHGSDLKKVKASRIFSFLFSAVKEDVALCVVPSDFYIRKLVRELDVPEEKVVKVFPDCVGDSGFSYNTSQVGQSETKSAFRIGYVSRLEKEKNCEELIRAFEKLSIPEVTLTIVGDGTQRNHLEVLVRQLGIEDKVEFLGALPRQELPEIMASFDVFVFPSVSETESFGLVGLEALSCGTPVIANQTLEGTREYLDHGVNGFFYTDGSTGLAASLKAFYEMSNDEKDKMSLDALRVKEKFSYENVFLKGTEIIMSRFA